ncbi:hypothetical protein M0805_003445 [Coniferiporia weirii]|nr:hypothetical protein M0805_003445 [Coniferiporia weirii]
MASVVSGQEHPGIMTWVSVIRTTMANDPGRQILEDQIQSSGFSFLEDYLDGILAGPRHDPIIELLKTPGRKRDAPKKTRAAVAAANKAAAIITMNLDDDDFNKENEAPAVNTAPVNAFHKALLQSKGSNSTNAEETSRNEPLLLPDASTRPTKPPSSKKKPVSKAKVVINPDLQPKHIVGEEGEKEEEAVVEKLVTPPRPKTLPADDIEMEPPHPLPSISYGGQVPVHTESTNELSVIAEDDESAERSRTSINIPQATQAPAQVKQSSNKSSGKSSKLSYKLPINIDMMTVMDIDDFTQTTALTVSSSASNQSFQTVPLDSPASAVEPITDKAAVPSAQSPEPLPAPHLLEKSPVIPSLSLKVQPEPVAQEHPADGDLVRKPGMSHLPTIGAPSPLRKSMRIPRESSLTTTYAMPAPGQKTMRSSWLVKAREAKAIEENAKKVNAMVTLPSSAFPAAIGGKRKSSEMLGKGHEDVMEYDEAERTQKMAKITETSPILSMLKGQDAHPHLLGPAEDATGGESSHNSEMHDDGLPLGDGSEGMINKLKKTVAGFSARAGKSMGKSLGGATASALAEARAAAEAKIAERNAAEGRIFPTSATTIVPAHAPIPTPTSAPTSVLTTVPPVPKEAKVPSPVFVPPSEATRQADSNGSKESDRRLSVSDLVTKYQTKKGVGHERVFQPPSPTRTEPSTSLRQPDNVAANTSASTTPPNSPPPGRPPIFTVPEKRNAQTMLTFFPPQSSKIFTQREPQHFAPSYVAQPFPSQSTFFPTQSTYAETLFDHEIPPWVPSTRDTDLSDSGLSQKEQTRHPDRDAQPETDLEADESWHLDEKFGETWSPVVVGMKDDSMTWSTAPTRSTRGGDTDGLENSVPSLNNKEETGQEHAGVKAPVSEMPTLETGRGTDEEDMDVEEYDGDVVGIRLVTPAVQSEVSLFSPGKIQQHGGDSSTNNTFSHGGFFSSASKLVSSVLGGSKKGKEPVKSIQLAAAAAKKQQEEAERKATRLREMETRRQQALQKKVEDEKAREEKKAKDEDERRRRDREKEDTTEKRVLRQTGKKLTQMEEDLTKKRKPTDAEKKSETKKPPSKDKKETKIGKFIPNTSQSLLDASAGPSKDTKQTSLSLAQSTTVKAVETKTGLPVKGKGKAKEAELEDRQPMQIMHAQMQARVQAHLGKAEMLPPPAPSESIELPDINSEYSDSDDEDRVRTFDPPHWAQSPELREALQTQSTVNPDDIFGAIKPLKMEELFKTRTSRFRARTSSANWAGTDELTAAEEKDYARRMGYSK